TGIGSGVSHGVCLHTINVDRQRGIVCGDGIIDDNDILPLTHLVGGKALNIHWRATTYAVVHSEIPAQTVVAREIGRIGPTLKKCPALAIRAGSITIVDWSLAAAGLIARRIEPGFNGEGLSIGGVEGRIEGDFCAGSVIEEFGAIRIAGDRAG